MALPRWIFFFLLLYCLVSESIGNDVQEEEFSEELLLKPFPDRKVLAHFHFESRVPPTESYGRHHHLFPKAIYQLVHKFRIREMELSFTQGRWNYERWGGYDPIPSNNAKPPGVELWAVFDVPNDQVDASWRNLSHALSGLFCASINFLESSTTYSAPDWGFRPFSVNLRYGTLPREAVCTENLTPWLKLLPCRDKAGLSTLMDRPSIYKGFYHSQRLRLSSTEFDSTGLNTGIVLEQTLTVVLQPSSLGNEMTHSNGPILQPSWSLSSLFGRKVGGKCVLAKSSNVHLHLEGALVLQLNKNEQFDASEDPRNNAGFELSVSPDRVIEESNDHSIFYEFLVENYSESKPFDLHFVWKSPLVWTCPQAPLHASRFLMGCGNERSAIAISLKPTKQGKGLQTANIDGDSCSLQVVVFQVVPWYVKVYYHTLQVFVDGRPQPVEDIIKKIHVSPSEDKISPGVMELALRVPFDVKSAALTIEFDKGFLHIDEYPPDANQGFDIPSAVVSFPDFQASVNFSEDTTCNSPLLSRLQAKSPVLSYTEVLLVPLTTPDFSMPYNVITITCTVFAIYFGSLLNVLRRRIGQEERYLKSKAAKGNGGPPLLLSKLYARFRGRPWEPPKSSSSSSSKARLLIKVILVAGIAVAWQYYNR